MQEFYCPTRIVMGSGAVSALEKQGYSRLFIVADPFFSKNGWAQRIGKYAREFFVFDQISPDPSVNLVAQGAARLREFSADAVVALGGGSAMDCAKAICCFSEKPLPLIAIPTFIHDFLCIHPFNDGNGRMSRLLTTLLLYRSGFYVGKYISLEAKIAKNKDLYYDALGEAQNGWHEENAEAVPFIKYLLGTILAAYKDFEDRFALVETKLPALETVRRAMMNKLGRFSKQDIRELCPSLSISSIEGALRKMVAEGEIKREGNGKNIRYFRLK